MPFTLPITAKPQLKPAKFWVELDLLQSGATRDRLQIWKHLLAYRNKLRVNLLPRHAIIVFNSIFAKTLEATGNLRQVAPEAIVAGVRDAQRIIAEDVLYLFQQIYPQFIAVCKEVLPDLEPISSRARLQKVERRFAGRYEEDISSIWEKLFQMGVIGKVDSSQQAKNAGDRYCYGRFHFNSDSVMGLATDAKYCFHPVFSRYFGVADRNTECHAVYPSDVDLLTLP